MAVASPPASDSALHATPVHRVGEQIFDMVADIGDVGIFSALTMSWLFRRRPRWSALVPSFYAIGVSSVPVVAITGTFIGMVLAVQAHSQFAMMGLATRLGSVINISLVKELGPVLAATMLAGPGRLGDVGRARDDARHRADRRTRRWAPTRSITWSSPGSSPASC